MQASSLELISVSLRKPVNMAAQMEVTTTSHQHSWYCGSQGSVNTTNDGINQLKNQNLS